MGAGVSFSGGEQLSVDGQYLGGEEFVVLGALPVQEGAALRGVKFTGRWGNQGEDYNKGFDRSKGRIRIVVLKQGDEVAQAEVSGFAPAAVAPFSVALDAAACVGGDRVEVRALVGGIGPHGKHKLHVLESMLSLVVTAAAPPETESGPPAGAAALRKALADCLAKGDTSALTGLPETFSAAEVSEAFGVEVLNLMTKTNSRQDPLTIRFPKAAVGVAALRSLQFFRWVVVAHGNKTYHRGTYHAVAEEAASSTNDVVNLLLTEFSRLVACKRPEVIRKIIALDHSGFFGGENRRDLDLGKIRDQLEVERETAALVFQMWADTKAGMDENIPNAMRNANICQRALRAPKQTDVILDCFRSKDLVAFQALRTWIASVSGLEGGASALKVKDENNVVNYKPIQSLFNKAYVRRGQMSSACIAGDIRRTTFTVATVGELERVAAALYAAFEANYAKKVDQFQGTAADQLRSISEMSHLDLPGGVRVTIYRFKPNSSQEGSEACSLYNMNFFLGAPGYYQAGLTAAYICACEIQLGVDSVVNGLRSDHTPYEKQRILDALPTLKAFNEGRCGSDCAAVNYDAINDGLFRRVFPRVNVHSVEHVEIVLDSPRSYTSRGGVSLDAKEHPIINDANMHRLSCGQNLVCWEHAVDANTVQLVEHLLVNVEDQGWGNVSLIVSFAMMMGPYVVNLSSRGFTAEEREPFKGLGGMPLIADDGYNFSGFSDKTIIPKGVSKILVIVCGRLHGDGHSMKYRGLSARISTLEENGAVRIN